MAAILGVRPGLFIKLLFPLPMDVLHEIWLQLAERFWRRRSLGMMDDDGLTNDGGRTGTR